jgi:hypothetical protein
MGKNLAETREMAQFEAELNRPDQITPFGNVTWGTGPGGRQTMTTALSPQQQRLMDQQAQAQLLMGRRGQRMLGAMPGAGQPVVGESAARSFGPAAQAGMSNPFNLLNMMGENTDFSAERGRVEKAQFDRAMALMNPEFARQEESLQQRLANQGLPQSSRAYASETGQFQDARNQATEQAAMAAILSGGAEQSRLLSDLLGTSEAGVGQARDLRGQLFGEDMARRQQGTQEAVLNRQIPFQELMQLFQMGQPQQPNVMAPPATGLTSYQSNSMGGPGFGEQMAMGGLGAIGNIAGGWLMGRNPQR